MLPTNAEIEQETLLDVSASVEEPKVPKVEEKKAPVNKIFMLVKMVAHLLTIVVPLAIVVPAVMSMSFFSWHPILMSIGYMLFMSQAMMLFSPSSSLMTKSSRADKVDMHMKLLFAALFCAGLGFFVIFYNKQQFDRPHFTSWHGLCGAATVGYTFMQVLAGLMLKNNRYFTQYLPKGFTLGKWKLVHGLSGFVCYSAACGVIMLGIYSSWYQGAVHEYVWCATGVGVLLLLGLALNHATELLKAQKAALQQRAKSVAAASKAGKK